LGTGAIATTAGQNNLTDWMYANNVNLANPGNATNRKLALRILGSGNIDVAVLTTAIQNFALARGFRIL